MDISPSVLERDSYLDGIQLALDVAGLAPGVGVVPDLVNAGISLLRGRRNQAMFSVLAAIPVIGDATGVAKLAARGVDFAAGVAARGAARGTSVLGHFPGYLQKAAELGARRFNIPPGIWEKMTGAERWAANRKFLDRLISRGDEVVLSTPLDQIRVGSTPQQEVQYLLTHGYEVADPTRLVPIP